MGQNTTKLEANPQKLWALNEMENTGGNWKLIKHKEDSCTTNTRVMGKEK